MRIESKRVSFKHLFVAFALIAAALFAVMRIPATYASAEAGERLITIHDRGEEKGLITKQTTLRAVFQEAHITLDKNDLVEPGLDQELIGNNYQVNIYRARPVVIVDGGTRQLVMTAYQTPKQIAEHAGIPLHDQDKASLERTNDLLTDGASERMTIERATPIHLTLYGQSDVVYTQAQSVAEFLKEKSIELASKDTLSVPLEDLLIPNMHIEIWHNGTQRVTKKEVIKVPVKQIQDADHEVGYHKVVTDGAAGEKMVTYEIVMKNGDEVSRKTVQTIVVKKPVERVEIVGAKPNFSGGFSAALSKLRACEAGGNYANKNNPLYRGAYQFSFETWGNRYGVRDPADASPAQQDQAARETYLRRGWQPWPNCGASLPDSFR